LEFPSTTNRCLLSQKKCQEQNILLQNGTICKELKTWWSLMKEKEIKASWSLIKDIAKKTSWSLIKQLRLFTALIEKDFFN
jgi:hypothetical protein